MYLQIDLLKSGKIGPLTERQDRAVAQISSSLDRTLRLLQDLLDVSRLQAGGFKIHPTKTDLKLLVDEVVATFDEPARCAGVRLQTESPGPMVVFADPHRILQVMTNLVTNALKFTPAGGCVTVALREDGRHAEIAVTDTGIGLGPDELARIFEPYYQVTGATSSKGTGLGLNICAGITAAHGGEIHAESAGAGRGTTFTVRLPKDP